MGKLKLLEKALGNLADVAKNSGPLNDLFETMKEGSMITAPWETFLNLLKAETTRASMDSIKELFYLLREDSTQTAISVLAAGFSGIVDGAKDLTTAFITLLAPLGETKEGLDAVTLVFKNLSLGLLGIPMAVFTTIKNILDKLGEMEGLFNAFNTWVGDINSFFASLGEFLAANPGALVPQW